MIKSKQAKPWVTIASISNAGSVLADDRVTLVKSLLERGFPVKLSRDDHSNDSESTVSSISIGDTSIDVNSIAAESLASSAEPQAASVDVLTKVLARVDDYHLATTEGQTPKKWKPWFPVIDFDRCTNCMQCLSFCLFDVYGVTADKKITVQNEDNCKTDCPACSRVCPEVAIMFPKYKAGPINGDAVSSDDVRREGMKVDISSLLGGDIYAMLRDRSTKAKSRFSAERDEDRALKERKRCLDKLKTLMGDLDIPAELLASLPSSDVIRSKAEAARIKAEEALSTSSPTPPAPDAS